MKIAQFATLALQGSQTDRSVETAGRSLAPYPLKWMVSYILLFDCKELNQMAGFGFSCEPNLARRTCIVPVDRESSTVMPLRLNDLGVWSEHHTPDCQYNRIS
jgi:hypothetical protein